MHPCLAIPEILSIICDYLRDERDEQWRRTWLLSLSATCRTFNGPATAALWSNLLSIKPLLRALPRDIFTDRDEFTLSKHIGPSDLVKLNFYARLVQELHVSWLPDTTCLAALQLSCTASFLPNLRSLHWYCVGAPALSFILMLVHPGVTTLEIDMALSSSHPLVSSLLPRLQSLCPDIRQFRLLDDDWAPRFRTLGYATHVAPRWERLQILDVPYLDGSDLEHLAAISQLHKLCIRSLPDDFHRSRISIDQPAFASLRTLELRPQAMHLATSFLQAIQPMMRLKSLKISPKETKRVDHWDSLLTSISRSCDPNTLRSLSVCDSARYDEDDDDLESTALSINVVQKLFVFRHLTALELDSWGGLSIDDEEFPALAQAFPDIEDLRLLSGQEDANRHDATIYAVASIAQFCPRLRVLHMDFDADAYIYEEHETRGIAQRSLTHMNVCYSPISSTRITAAFLSALFPNLDTIESEGIEAVVRRTQDEEWTAQSRRAKKMKWRQVARLLPMLRFVRAQERRDSCLRRLEGEAEEVERDSNQHNQSLDADGYDTDYSDL
ncbi:uncharacterized protein SCHCODRAFT_02552383 [Schizophyllum commune H4-8]|nr:uncharacterized protein SCHCODRAFT_02552383 [Schizophyllum commune H4-8]KAI5887444.1 hypothetical protein SCHCODRAFT_02552383 [Schizophyllum commune H4-8]